MTARLALIFETKYLRLACNSRQSEILGDGFFDFVVVYLFVYNKVGRFTAS